MLVLKPNRLGMCICIIMLVFFCLAPFKNVVSEDARPALIDIKALQEQAEREGWTFTVGDNPAVHRTMDELCGMVEPDDWREGAKFETFAEKALLPDRLDWREVVLPPIRDQGGCGSCWAFSTVGTLECNIKIADNETVDLSEQWLVSCNQDNWGCGGGWHAHDYHMWKTDSCGDSGAVLEEDFLYEATELPCNCPYPHSYYIEDWAFIEDTRTRPSVNAMKQAIMEYGPITVTVFVDFNFRLYTGGIYNFNKDYDGSINHGVVLVGWDDNQGEDGVWFLRNSWGPEWGEDGYMRIEYDCSNIGFAACYIVYMPKNPDIDGDGVDNIEDNCLWVYNPDQINTDGDKYGDSCDLCPYSIYNDIDYDDLCGDVDNCPEYYNPDQLDDDNDGAGDDCDNCLGLYNPDQVNTDGDQYGEACDDWPNDPDNDTDGDNICGSIDNCPSVYNPDQTDSDGDGVGDACAFTGLVSTYPEPNELNVPVDVNIVIEKESESLLKGYNLSSEKLSYILVRGSQSGRHYGDTEFDPAENKITFDPFEDFKAGEQVTVTLITDPADLSCSWSFTIGVNTDPPGLYYEDIAHLLIRGDPVFVDAADLNGDGYLDLVAFVNSSMQISVVMNNGDGTFAPFYAKSSNCHNCEGLILTDFDSDNDIDLLTLNSSLPSYVCLYKNNGDGTLQNVVGNTTNFIHYDIGPLDLNLDGHIDLATAGIRNDGAAVSIMMNDGFGDFSVIESFFDELDMIRSIFTGDLNGDNKYDMVVGSYYSNPENLYVLINDGLGGFPTSEHYPLYSNISHFEGADFDADGDIDLVAVTDDSLNLSYLANNGDGTFSDFVEYPMEYETGYITSADIDGDGDIDLITCSIETDRVTVHLNNGLGDFSYRTDISRDDSMVTTSICLADIDNDEIPELILGKNADGWTTGYLYIYQKMYCNDPDGDGLGDPDDANNVCPDDNCPLVCNPDQADIDNDGIGDACDAICCLAQMTGNVNCSKEEEPDVADITRLIDFLYLSHDALCCPGEGDCDGSGGTPDISDITRLINYLYLDHNPLANCP